MTEELKSAEDAVAIAEANLVEAKRKATHQEYPKWIEPHASHVVDTGGHLSVPLFPEFHVDRHDGKVTVKVMDEDHEAIALAAKQEPKASADEKAADDKVTA